MQRLFEGSAYSSYDGIHIEKKKVDSLLSYLNNSEAPLSIFKRKALLRT